MDRFFDKKFSFPLISILHFCRNNLLIWYPINTDVLDIHLLNFLIASHEHLLLAEVTQTDHGWHLSTHHDAANRPASQRCFFTGFRQEKLVGISVVWIKEIMSHCTATEAYSTKFSSLSCKACSKMSQCKKAFKHCMW